MKKIMMLLIAAVMLFGVSGQAMAAFSNGDLIQVVYQRGGSMEVATDLGAFSATTAYAGSTMTLGSNPFPTAGTGPFATAAQSDLYVAYYVAGATNAPVWVSGPAGGQTSGNRQGASAALLSTQVNAKYLSLGGTQVQLAQSDPQSYYTKMDSGGTTLGGFSSFIPGMNGEVSLGTTAYVDTYLYYYATPNANGAKAGVQVATIRTYANGATEMLGQVSTPIPASVMLLGSGLMGLVGMRRKQSV
jgi:hypothetical protein